MITWEDRFSMGNPLLDRQHKEFFSKVNEFYDSCVIGVGEARIEEFVIFMENHAREHFAAEEAHFADNNYPGLDGHCVEHLSFLERIAAIKRKLDMGEYEEDFAMEVARFGSEWLSSHTRTADWKFVEWIRERG